MVDTHAHLGLCEPDDGELVAAAVEAGVTRILTVGIDVAASREAIAAAEAETGLPADDPVRFGAERLLDAIVGPTR